MVYIASLTKRMLLICKKHSTFKFLTIAVNFNIVFV
jgi:hypothetical protein